MNPKLLCALILLPCAWSCSSDDQSSDEPSAPSTTTIPADDESAIDLSQLSGRIAFSYDDGVWVSDANGENRVQLTHDGGFDPTWSPDGTSIVYRTLTGTDDGELWVMNADGTNVRNLVNDPDFADWGPAWSPDGTLIAFNSNRATGGAHSIWVMNADGSDQRMVISGHGEYPTWSPDSQSLAYAGDGTYNIRLVMIDGTGDDLVIGDSAYEMSPAWSPDGEWIAFHTQADFDTLGERGMGPEMEIHLIRPDGTDDHRITDNFAEDGFPEWSPDGNYLMWVRHGELVIARPDGSGLVEIGAGNFPSWVA